jgi:anti-anti-sigma factor
MRNQQERQVAAVVALPAEIDFSNAERACVPLDAALAAGAGVVIADCTSTVFCDTWAVRRLLMVHRKATARDAELRLTAPPGGPMERMLELMGVTRMLRIYPSLDQAAAA